MRVLWLSPWLRPRARIHAENLQRLGVDVMLVTAPLHPEPEGIRSYEVELIGRPLPTKGWLPFLSAYRQAVRFQPDVVVTEMLRDPRWRALARLAPRIRFVHDDAPHDETDELPWWNHMFFRRWDAKADATVVFSDYVRRSLKSHGLAKDPIFVAPLTSDLAPDLAPDFVPAEERRNFILVGRQKPYKNHDVIFSAWEEHVEGSEWRGDELVIYGGGDIPRALPPHTHWHRGSYRYSDVVAGLAASKGSLIHSRKASQSGVQVLSMYLGVPTLVSEAGGLPEYQPEGLSVTGIDDVGGLTRAINALADPQEVARQAELARRHYATHYEGPIAAKRLTEVFQSVSKANGRRN